MLKPLSLIVWILLYCVPNFAQQNRIDSVTQLIERSADKNQKGGLLIYRSKSNTVISMAKAKEDAQQALAYFQETGNVEGQVNAYLQFSGLYSREAKYKLALDIDSICYALAKQKMYKKGIAIALSNMGRNLQQVGDMQKAKTALLESNEMFKEAGLESETAEIKNRLGVLYRRIGDFKSSLKYFDEALTIATKFNLTNSLANIYMNKGNTLDEYTAYDEAIKNHLQSIIIRENTNDLRGLAQNYNNIANVYTHTGNYDEAIKYYQKTKLITENLRPQNKTSLALAYNNLANGYVALKQYDSVEILFKKAIVLFTETGEKPGLALVYHDLGGYYIDIKEYKTAMVYLNEALDIRKGSLLINDEASTRNLIGVALGKLNKHEEAEQSLLQALAMVKNNNTRLQEAIYNSLAKHYNQIGNYEKAIEYQAKYFNLKDTLLSESEAINMLKEKANYELEKKETALKLSVKEKQLDALKLDERNKTIAFLTIGMALLGLLLGLVIYYLKQKQKTAKVLLLKNEKIEILVRELHHRVKNNLQVVSGLLSLQSNRLEDETAKQAMDAGRSRVDAMALIHQKLYMDESLESVNIETYISNLTTSLAMSFGFDNRIVKTEILLQKKDIDIDIAIPIGLIINELLTNAFKHAFIEIENALINISLRNNYDGSLQLVVEDNGKGIAAGLTNKENFGMKLVYTLVEQLNGSLILLKEKGTSYNITINPIL